MLIQKRAHRFDLGQHTGHGDVPGFSLIVEADTDHLHVAVAKLIGLHALRNLAG